MMHLSGGRGLRLPLGLCDVLIQQGNVPLLGSLLDGRRGHWRRMLLYHLRISLLLLHRHLLIGAQ